MSLSRAAARIAARYALLGETLAEDRVYDSAISPLDVTVEQDRKPLAIVMTDDDGLEIEGRDMTHGERKCELVIVIAVTGAMEVDSDGVAVSLMASDAGLDLALDILEHQVLRVLQEGVSPWAGAFRAMSPRTEMLQSRRGGGDDGIKFAARQIVVSCDLIDVPDAGAPVVPGSSWDTFLTVAGAEPATQETANLMRSLIEGQPLDEWERARRALGVSDETSIGLGPVIIADSDEFVLDGLDIRGNGSTATVEPE